MISRASDGAPLGLPKNARSQKMTLLLPWEELVLPLLKDAVAEIY